jgi:hypothetical protein
MFGVLIAFLQIRRADALHDGTSLPASRRKRLEAWACACIKRRGAPG